MSQPYSSRYFPPAPVLEVSLISEVSQLRIGPYTALIDTGTDVTAVPVGLLARIAAPAARQAYVQAQWGSRLRVPLHTVDIEIAGLRLPGMEVIADKRGQEIILGRDVLNKLWLGLAGPQLHHGSRREKPQTQTLIQPDQSAV
ncbi:MAG: hypothetical protein HY870_24755 [Chloroflexi bacterium]|nr:hypothetical protein [Chloroflexota bacterium]